MGLAPTTSTTMQMALGDALAVALLTRRGFTAADFHQIHPGGRLGTRLRRVRDLMHTGDAMPLAPPNTPMDRALLLMTEKRFGCLGVVGPTGRLIGIVTDGDLRRAMGPDLLCRHVVDIMTGTPRTIAPDALVDEALHAMNARERPITSLFVVDLAGRPLGILHIHDLLRAGVA
jgi:arabinose-5-phosphate isomerase